MPIELETPDKLEYHFYPAVNGVVNFRVRAANDAHLALTTGPADSGPVVEVFLGGWSNSKSVIRSNRNKPEAAEASTPNILSPGEFRGFWVRWTANGVITVGKEGEAAAFLSWENPEPFPIAFFGICTGWGAAGSWIVDDSQVLLPQGGATCWVPAKDGEIPPEAVSGGQDGEVLYVARARHENAIIPGKLVPSHGVCYVAFAGGEHSHAEYEVLCGSIPQWAQVTGGVIPPQAIPAGESDDGEPLFVGRVQHEGTITIGKIQPSHGVCYISYGGQELAFQDYEILLTN